MTDFTNLKNLMKGFTQTGPAGCALGVSLNGKRVFEHYEGWADMENKLLITQDSIYRAYSSTKPVTAVAALMLYERGVYLMNDPVAAYLPEFSNQQVCHYAGNNVLTVKPPKREMRVRDVFTMTTGLPYGGQQNMTQRAISKVQQRLEEQGGYTLAQYIKAVGEEVPLAFDPGESWNYGISMDLLGRLIEVWSGKSFGRFLQEELFDPLGMKDASFFFRGDLKQRLAVPYERVNGQLKRYENKGDAAYEPETLYESGGGGLLASLDDLLRLGEMLVMGGTRDGVRILGRKTVDFMRQNHLTPPQLEAFRHTHEDFWHFFTGYGYGLGVRTMMDPQAAGSNGSMGEFGWAGAAGTWLLVDPAEGLAVQYMHQMLPANKNEEWYCHPRVRNAVYAAL